MRRLSPNAKTILGGLAAVAVVALVVGVFRFKRFVDEDPRLCATCHRANPEFALWMGGSHRTVACQRCHHATPRQGVAMLRSFIAGNAPKGKHADVEVGACASCHFSHDPQWPQVGGSRGHKLHHEEQGIACVRCHAASMHGFEPVAAKCEECHPGHTVGVKGMQALHCFACHDFLTTQTALLPTRRDCLRCHSAQGIHAPMNDHGAPMEMSCATCHHPHREPGKTITPCGECHRPEMMKQGGLHARAGHADCVRCHAPHTWTPEPTVCASCHAGAAGHAAGRPCLSCHSFSGAPVPPRAAAADTPWP